MPHMCGVAYTWGHCLVKALHRLESSVLTGLEVRTVRGKYLLAWPLIIGPLGVACWVLLIKRIAPNLTQDEATFACVLGIVAILCLSMMGAFLFWILIEIYQGRVKIGRIS